MSGYVRPDTRSQMEIIYIKPDEAKFKVMVRYIGPQDIITIPKKVSRELGIKLGDIVNIKIRKKGEIK